MAVLGAAALWAIIGVLYLAPLGLLLLRVARGRTAAPHAIVPAGNRHI